MIFRFNGNLSGPNIYDDECSEYDMIDTFWDSFDWWYLIKKDHPGSTTTDRFEWLLANMHFTMIFVNCADKNKFPELPWDVNVESSWIFDGVNRNYHQMFINIPDNADAMRFKLIWGNDIEYK